MNCLQRFFYIGFMIKIKGKESGNPAYILNLSIQI